MPPTTSSPPPSHDDWTRGPAKWAAVLILAAAAITGMTWSITARTPHPRLSTHAPITSHINDVGQPLPSTSTTPAATDAPTPGLTSPPAHLPTSPSTRLININTATEAELELLPGIGPAMARRITEDRAKRGPFKSIDNLDRVRGIGPETLRKIRPVATVE